MNDTEIARVTGIPRRTVFDWRRDRRRPDTRYDRDPVPEELPPAAYAYLLGIYLGDGSIARVRRDRWSVRYAFANRSSDIKRLFCRSCDALAIRWTVTPKQVSVYRKESVAVLDSFIGPKA